MMSLSVLLLSPMFRLGSVSVQRGLCPSGSLSRGVSVLCPESLCPGGLCPGGFCQGDPPGRDPLYVEEWVVCIPTGMLSCFTVFFHQKLI